jgi:hypothetical protein
MEGAISGNDSESNPAPRISQTLFDAELPSIGISVTIPILISAGPNLVHVGTVLLQQTLPPEMTN